WGGHNDANHNPFWAAKERTPQTATGPKPPVECARVVGYSAIGLQVRDVDQDSLVDYEFLHTRTGERTWKHLPEWGPFVRCNGQGALPQCVAIEQRDSGD